jgi:hypothetical protein
LTSITPDVNIMSRMTSAMLDAKSTGDAEPQAEVP